MLRGVTIEDRLHEFASFGKTSGFSLKLWKRTAKKLEREGIIVSNPRGTGRKGEYQYDIDFTTPIPGTLSGELFIIAHEAQKAANNKKNSKE